MRSYRCIVAICLAIFSITQVWAQNNANTILQGVYGKLQKARDYSVQANIKVDMPLIRILPVEVFIYYKQKDKFAVKSKSIAIVPRQGFDQIPKMLADANSYTAMIQGEETIGNIKTNIINVIPLSDTSDLILGKLWIDTKQSVIIKSQLTTRSSGTIDTEYTYGNEVAFGLPNQMIFTVDASKFKMPKSVSHEMNAAASDKNNKEKNNKKGKIFITLTNYQINKGIADSMFEKK